MSVTVAARLLAFFSRTAPTIFEAAPSLTPVILFALCSEITSEGKRVTKLDQILLNGNNVAMMVPGGDPEAPDAQPRK